MKTYVLSVLLFLTFNLFGQDLSDCVIVQVNGDSAPAPCSIEHPLTQAEEVWMVRVGIYQRFITTAPSTLVMRFGHLYHYFFTDNGKAFYTQAQAKSIAVRLRRVGVFCDAYAVKSPIESYIFKLKPPY